MLDAVRERRPARRAERRRAAEDGGQADRGGRPGVASASSSRPCRPSATSAATRRSSSRPRTCASCSTPRTGSSRASSRATARRATSSTPPSARSSRSAWAAASRSSAAPTTSCTTSSTRWDELSREGRSLTGVASGFTDLDAITGGFQPGNLIIIAARPSMGKSALVTNIAENVALAKDNPRPVALFSLEMSEAELAQRFIASQASIKGDDLRKGRVRDDKWARVLRAAGDYEQRRPLRRRLVGHRPARHPRQGPAPSPAALRPGRAGPDHRRLPAADARRRRATTAACSRSAR